MSISLGPIIGSIENQKARILIEFNQQSQQTLILKNVKAGTQQELSLEVEANRPKIFEFSNIQPSNKYVIIHQNQQIGSFKSFCENENNLNFSVVSCHTIDKYEKFAPGKKLFSHMRKQIENQQIDLILHIGDQVYADNDYWEGDKQNVFGEVEKLLEGKSPEEFDTYKEECRNLLRNLYRRTWNEKDTAYCLANCPSRMMLDDHELVDDAGKNPKVNQEGSWQKWYVDHVGRYVYYEYQKQLSMDVNFEDFSQIQYEYQSFVYNNCGFFLIDNRAHFLWHGDKWEKGQSYLGERQKNYLMQDCLGFDSSLQKCDPNKGLFKNCKSVFILSTIPMVFFSQRITNIGELAIDDFNNFWAFDHEKELCEVLEYFRLWQEQPQKKRVLTLIGGDVHIGGHYDIKKNNKTVMKQLIASSLSNKTLSKLQKIVFDIATDSSESLQNDFSFEKYGFVVENNYGMVRVKPNGSTAVPNVQLSLVSNKNTNCSEQQIYSNLSKIKGNQSSSCCSIF